MDISHLISRLEEATEGSRHLDCDIHSVAVTPVDIDTLGGHLAHIPHYTTSIDAALTLVPEGHSIDMATCIEMGAAARVYQGPIRENSAGEPSGHSKSLAPALVIAALRARDPNMEG